MSFHLTNHLFASQPACLAVVYLSSLRTCLLLPIWLFFSLPACLFVYLFPVCLLASLSARHLAVALPLSLCLPARTCTLGIFSHAIAFFSVLFFSVLLCLFAWLCVFLPGCYRRVWLVGFPKKASGRSDCRIPLTIIAMHLSRAPQSCDMGDQLQKCRSSIRVIKYHR